MKCFIYNKCIDEINDWQAVEDKQLGFRVSYRIMCNATADARTLNPLSYVQHILFVKWKEVVGASSIINQTFLDLQTFS